MLYCFHHGREQLVLAHNDGFQILVLQKLYYTAVEGHLAASKMVKAIQAKVWWPRMRANMDTYVEACPTCQRVKDHTIAKLGLF